MVCYTGVHNRRSAKAAIQTNWAVERMQLRKFTESVFLAGLVLGVGAAAVQAYFHLIPPTAYGVCMVCHPKELVNWLADHLLGTHWGYAMAAVNAPILTVIGVVAGAACAARQNGEFSLRPARNATMYFAAGFLMINFGLILGSCPIRVVILSAYGSLMGMAGWACVLAGVGLGILALRWRASRST